MPAIPAAYASVLGKSVVAETLADDSQFRIAALLYPAIPPAVHKLLLKLLPED